MQAFIIYANGDTAIQNIDPALTLAHLQKLVGGTVQMVMFPDLGLNGYVNEDGKLIGLPVNVIATDLWRSSFLTVGSAHAETLVGPVVLLGGIDSAGQDVGLTEAQLAELTEAVTVRLNLHRES